MKGLVIKSTGSKYLVKSGDEIFECLLKGKIRLEGRKTTNPVAVGDIVEVEKDKNNEYSIVKIEARKNYIIRKSINLSKQSQILASNLDQAIIIATLVAPRTSLGFIDRFLVTAEAYHIPAKIIFNKCDLLDEKSRGIQQDIIQIYSDIGYTCYEVSATENIGIRELEIVFKDKTTLITGHSGVGKSSFINALQPQLNLKTGRISSAHLKGMHTTTFAELFIMDFGGYIIDTPGIKELGLVEMKKEELGHYFPEIRKYMADCKFNNCLHINEPKCAVIKAVEDGNISEERYKSYFGMLNGEEMDWKEWEI
ncbi:MAG: ribosome small subunit-dependent GTPase A [Bacteroidota bacterium]